MRQGRILSSAPQISLIRSFTMIGANPFLALANAEHSVIMAMPRRSVTGKRTGIPIRLELDELRSLRWPSCPPTLTERLLGLQHQHSPMFSNMRSWAGNVAFIACGTKAQPLIQRDRRHHVIGTTFYSMTVVWLMITLGALLVICGGYLHLASDFKLARFRNKK